MSANITLIDTEYKGWVAGLCRRFRQSQLKASVKVNREMLLLYWSIGRDIVELKAETRWGDKLLQNLSRDLKRELPESKSFSPTNLLYMKNFYLLYSPLSIGSVPPEEHLTIAPQAGEQITFGEITPQAGEQIESETEATVRTDIFSVPWGHHKVLIDKYKENPKVALFYVAKTVENGWSRSMLLNFIDTDLHKRQGAALTNFSRTLPAVDSDLAREITKDPYNFAFTGITERYNEAQLKAALLSNITKFLIELGSGFAYVGREYRLQIGNTENFIDLLFYNLQRHALCHALCAYEKVHPSSKRKCQCPSRTSANNCNLSASSFLSSKASKSPSLRLMPKKGIDSDRRMAPPVTVLLRKRDQSLPSSIFIISTAL